MDDTQIEMLPNLWANSVQLPHSIDIMFYESGIQ